MFSKSFVSVVLPAACFSSFASANIDLTARHMEHNMSWLYGYQGDARTQSDHDLIDNLMTDLGVAFGHSNGIFDRLADGGNYFGHDWTVDGEYGSSSHMQNYPNYSNIAAYPHDLQAMTMYGQTHSTTSQTGNALTSLTTTALTRYSFSVSGNLGGPSPIQLSGMLRETGIEADALARLEWFGPFGWQALALWASSPSGQVSFDQTFLLNAGESYRVEISTYARDVGLQPAQAEWDLTVIDLAATPEPGSLALLSGACILAQRRRR